MPVLGVIAQVAVSGAPFPIPRSQPRHYAHTLRRFLFEDVPDRGSGESHPLINRSKQN
jgi:hypothetical protein